MSGTHARRRTFWSTLLLSLAGATAWLSLLGPSCGPWDRTPGFLLLGEHVASPVSNWEFVRMHPEIALETRTPWLVPHSVTVAWLLVDGELFIPSRDAARKRWVGHVLRQPEMRLRIGEQIYDARLVRVEDSATLARLAQLAADKWPQLAEQAATLWFFRVEPRESR